MEPADPGKKKNWRATVILKATGILAFVATLLLVIIEIVAGNDMEDIQRRVCQATGGRIWSCATLKQKDEKEGAKKDGVGPSEPARDEPPPPVVVDSPVRPQIALDGTIYRDGNNRVSVQVRAKVTNTSSAPLLVFWGDLNSDARVTLDGGRSLTPHTQGNANPPVAIPYCGAPQPCWERRRADFPELQPGESLTGILTFSGTVEEHELDAVLNIKAYSLVAPVVYARPTDATAKVFTLSRDGEALRRRR